jgi:glycosyltransferase involved in cell wall biosynthesis
MHQRQSASPSVLPEELGSPRDSAKLRVAVDARTLNRTHLRGIGKYLREVVDRGARWGQVDWLLFADRPDLPLHLSGGRGPQVEVCRRRGDRFHRWEQLSLPLRAKQWGAGLLHCPSNTLPWWQGLPTVVTLHDTIMWNSTEEGPPDGWYLGRLLPSAYRRCAAIITVSETSRRDIVSMWPNLRDKIHVVSHGIEESYLASRIGPLSEPLLRLGVRRPYLLYMGGAAPRKRLQWAIRVLEGLGDSEVRLIACGVDEAIQDRFRSAVREDVRSQVYFVPFVPDEHMPALYQNAAAVLYPTLYEGFGLPALEAQAVGAPVLFSALGSLAELQGPGAVMVPPYDLEAWIGVCRRLVAQRGESASLDQGSRRWASSYSWDRCAERHLEVYRQASTDHRFIGRARQHGSPDQPL